MRPAFRIAALALTFAALTGAAHAQLKKSDTVVKAEAKADKIGADGTQLVTITLTIDKGWHLYANPTGVEILKPTTLVLEPAPAVKALRVSYPKGQAKVLGSLGKEEVRLYEGKIDISVRLTLAEGAVPGKVGVQLKLKYQACDDKVCLAPASVTIPLEFTIATPDARTGDKP